MHRLPVFLTLIFTWWLVLATRYGNDRSLLLQVTREDGPIEWATVIALMLLAIVVAKGLLPAPAALSKSKRLLGWALVALSVMAAGEEISWGQRILGFETGKTMARLNYQHETNLHNLIPAELFNGIIVFALGIGFVLAPLLWRKLNSNPPNFLPSQEASLMMLNAILVNHYRFTTAPEKVGILIILAVLIWQTIEVLKERNWVLLLTLGFGWVTALILYNCKAVLRAANAQYEIRELIIVTVAIIWSWQTLASYKTK